MLRKKKKRSSPPSSPFGQQKILNHLDKVNNWFDGKQETIITAEFCLTNICNSKCPKCCGGKGKGGESLTGKEARDYIKQLADFGVRGLTFTGGGEPTLHPAIEDLILYAKKQGLDVALISNGIVMSNALIDCIVENCKWCRISLDAGVSKDYRKTHGLEPDDFYKVVDNTRRLAERKKKLKSNTTIGVGYLTNEEALLGMELSAILAKELGVDYWQARPYHWNKTDISKELKKCEELNDDNFKVVSSWQKYSHFNDEIERPYKKCYGINFTTFISATAEVMICCHLCSPQFSLGSLREKSFAEIWENRQSNPIYEKIVNQCPPFCRADEFNRLLWEMKQKKTHINFI